MKQFNTIFNTIVSDQRGMGLSTKIALGFLVAVLVVFVVGLVAYFVAG